MSDSLADYIQSAPKKAKKKKAVKKVAEKKIEPKIITKTIEKPVAPVIKVIEHPDYSPIVMEQTGNVGKMAEQAIASMRDSVNNNQAVVSEIIRVLTNKPMPIRFDIQRDKKGDMSSLTPVYGKIKT